MFTDRFMAGFYRWLWWIGPIFVVLYLYTWVYLGHNWLPPSPAYTGAELVANYYVPYRADILLGMVLSAFFAWLYYPWSLLLSTQMAQREPDKFKPLSHMQLFGGGMTAWVMSICPAGWVWCAKYAGTPGIDPEMVKMVHQWAWYVYFITYGMTFFQCVATTLFAYFEKPKGALKPLFPRWVGHASVFTMIWWFALSVIPYFDKGPFSVEGFVNYHVTYLVWFVWMGGCSFYLYRDLKRVEASPTQAVGQAMATGSRA